MNKEKTDVDKHDLEAACYIIENSDGSEKRIGDFVIRCDYGANVYYYGKGGDVSIPEQVGDASLWDTFKKVTNITSLSFPGTVKTVSAVTLGSRKNLRRLVFNEGIEAISETNFFANCKELKDISIPESLCYLGAHAFQKTPWYQKQVEIVEGCHYLGRFLVDSDEGIKRAAVRKGTIMICGKAFLDRTELQEVIIPDGVETIGAQAFFHCDALSTISLPASVKLVEKWSLVCRGLKHIEIANPKAEISEDAFGKESFGGIFYPEYAYIPTIVKGSPAQMRFFAYCYLTSKECFSPELQAINDTEVKKRKKALLDIIMDKENIKALSNIAPFAISAANIFALIEAAQRKSNPELTAFLLDWKEKNVSHTDLEKQQKKEMNRDPMSAGEQKKIWGTKKLVDGTLEITSYKGKEMEIVIPECIGKAKITSIGKEAFSALPMLKKFPDEVTKARRQICSVTIPNGITSIGLWAFNCCVNLKKVVISASVTTIITAFSDCPNIVIHAPAGSYAEQYAKEHNIPFVAE